MESWLARNEIYENSPHRDSCVACRDIKCEGCAHQDLHTEIVELKSAINKLCEIDIGKGIRNDAPENHGSNLQKYYENIYKIRRLRDEVFSDCGIFSDPAWDILLDLTVAELKGVRLSVTSVCIGACAPATTALRWIAVLEEKGLVCRESDSLDGRRTYIRISAKGNHLMRRIALNKIL